MILLLLASLLITYYLIILITFVIEVIGNDSDCMITKGCFLPFGAIVIILRKFFKNLSHHIKHNIKD